MVKAIILLTFLLNYYHLNVAIGQDLENQQAEGGLEMLKDILDVEEKVLLYLDQHVDNINLDGIIGVRSVEGQIGSILARYWTQLPFWAVTRMRRIQQLATSISERSIPPMKKRTPAYFANAGEMLESNFWSVYYPKHRLIYSLLFKGQKNYTQFDEHFSDDCIKEFYPKKNGKTCQISDKCWMNMILPENYQAYSLTHQVFYLLNAIQANCLTEITVMARRHMSMFHASPIRHLFDKFCVNINREAVQLERQGFPLESRDLVMEQIGLCGLSGYTQIAHWKWWNIIKGWQKESGCFGVFADEKINPANFYADTYGNNRRKRAESLIASDGCLSHRSSVALDAILAYTRRVIEDVLLNVRYL